MTTRHHHKKKQHPTADESAQAAAPAEQFAAGETSPPPEAVATPRQGSAAAADAPPPAPSPESSLAEKIGGENAIASAVEILTRKLGGDPRINYFLFGLSESERGEQHRTFLTLTLGGPDEQVGDDLRRAYARLANKGLKDRHVDVLLDHLRDTLKELDVTDEFAEAAVTSAGALRDILLGR